MLCVFICYLFSDLLLFFRFSLVFLLCCCIFYWLLCFLICCFVSHFAVELYDLQLCFGFAYVCILYNVFSVSSVSLPVYSCRRVLSDVIHESNVALIQLHSQRVMILLIK